MKNLSNTVLVVAPAWIGDMVMAQSLFKLMRQNNPSVIIDVLAPGWTLPVIERMPEVRLPIHFPFSHGQLGIKNRHTFAQSLKKTQYDQSIVLPNSFKSALVPLWAKIPKRTGWLGEWRIGLLNDFRSLNRKEFPLMVQQFCALGLPKGHSLPSDLQLLYPSLRVDDQKRCAALNRLGLSIDLPIIALCPGAEYGPAKRWPAAYFAGLAERLQSKGWQVWIFGSSKERSYAQEIIQKSPNCIDLTGKTSLVEAVDLLSLSQAVVTNDSGLMHIAAAVQRPLVVLYGSSTPAFTPPLSLNVEIVHLGLDCSPCFKRSCPLGHFNCMRQISPDVVLTKLLALIENDQDSYH